MCIRDRQQTEWLIAGLSFCQLRVNNLVGCYNIVIWFMMLNYRGPHECLSQNIEDYCPITNVCITIGYCAIRSKAKINVMLILTFICKSCHNGVGAFYASSRPSA